MEFNIPCDTYKRLSVIARNLNERCSEWFGTIRVEIKDGDGYAIATNRTILAIEYLGKIEQPNGTVHIRIDDALLQQCETEIPLDGKISVVYNEMLGFASAKTTFGFMVNGDFKFTCAADNEFDKWRKALPNELPKKTNGAMYMHCRDMLILMQSAPSGSVVFQEHIDQHKAAIMRDTHNDKWLGLFLPERVENGKAVQCEPATIPEWI